jgi:hypothetical protein
MLPAKKCVPQSRRQNLSIACAGSPHFQNAIQLAGKGVRLLA